MNGLVSRCISCSGTNSWLSADVARRQREQEVEAHPFTIKAHMR